MTLVLTAARWANREHTEISVEIDAVPTRICAIEGLAIYDAILGQNVSVEEYRPTADDVRAEAQRRIISLCGAGDFNACITKQLNAAMRAMELTHKRAIGIAPTADEEVEEAALQRLADGIKSIRAASNTMEALPPNDYLDDTRWPVG